MKSNPAPRWAGRRRFAAAFRLLGLGALLTVVPLGHLSAQVERPRRPSPVLHQGLIEGVVQDGQGHLLADVLIVLRRLESEQEWAAVSDGQGRFAFPQLPGGDYRLGIEMAGFEPLTRDQSLPAGQRISLEIEVKVVPVPSRAPIRRPPERGGATQPPSPPSPPQAAYPPLRERPPADARPAMGGERAEIALPGTEAEFEPPGYAGAERGTSTSIEAVPDFVPVSDRWRLGLPRWERYPDSVRGVFPYVRGRRLDPYNQNVLKGDYPILGNNWFLNLEFDSFTVNEYRRLPVVGPPSAERPAEPEFFSKGDQYQFIQEFLFSADFFHGYTKFKPFDLRFRVTPAVSLNYLNVNEVGLVNIDLREGTTRPDAHASLEEAFVEIKLAETSPFYDFLSVRTGTQFFNSDFRGFIFLDNQPGLRLFGNFKANKHQYNLAYFYMLEKDTNSLLNTFESRQQHVAVANYYIQDFIKLGYTTQFSVHFNNDRPSLHFNRNDFPVRPAPLSNVVPKSVNALYLGWAGDGHFGVWNISHAFYQVLGNEKPNQIAGDVFGPRSTEINAQMAALELSIDRDWRRYRGSFYFASGDADPNDDRARGFDAIVDEPFFAGGEFSFWNRQEVRLSGTAVGLVHRFSFNPNLRSAKEEGQANFVNPGLMLFNGGIDAELTTKLKGSLNVNVLSFVHTEVLEALLFQSDIGRFIGTDVSLGFEYRPKLNNNIIFTGGVAGLVPGDGFRDVFTSKSLLSAFVEVRLAY
ncbi:MAG TPA: carboxypeptidase-like regulatory domain-containing protein [Acidobacteriota bacterium]|nr:carboxypeptidase-like regulatory domain-containing protein [Acidobacteriota bacterium]